MTAKAKKKPPARKPAAKRTRPAAKPQAEPKQPEPKAADPRVDAGPSPVPPGINDRREDTAAILGHFVDVIDGDHKGRYGVFEEAEGDNAIVRTRDADNVRIVCKISDLVPALAGRA